MDIQTMSQSDNSTVCGHSIDSAYTFWESRRPIGVPWQRQRQIW